MSGLLAMLHVACGSRKGRKEKEEKQEEADARAETVVVTPGAVQLQTRSPY